MSEQRFLLIVEVCYTPSYVHFNTCSHLLIFKPSHLCIFASSHLHIFPSSHLHIFSLSLLLSPSLSFSLPLLIFTSSHLLSLSLLLPPSPLSFSPSLSLSALCHGLSPCFSFLSWGRGQCRQGDTKRQPFRTK